MFTSDGVDLHGVDRIITGKLRRYLSREAFRRARVFSYPAYLLVSQLARIPTWDGLPALKRLRSHANSVLMYMMQTHMLHDMYVTHPRWMEPIPKDLNG
jgi:hypothetical protein